VQKLLNKTMPFAIVRMMAWQVLYWWRRTFSWCFQTRSIWSI